MTPFPSRRYNVIYADPPWSYRDSQQSGGTAFFGASVRYPTMRNADIVALPVADIVAPDCALFLWATSPLLPEALDTIRGWGFRFKTVAFCWNKQSSGGKWIANMGRWTMGNVEICLLGVRGRPQRIARNIRQLVIAPRTRHSEKPDEVRQRIVALMGDVPRIELFARQTSPGWDAWGNEITTQEAA